MMFLFPSGGICYFPRGYHEFWMTKWCTKCDNHPPEGIRGINDVSRFGRFQVIQFVIQLDPSVQGHVDNHLKILKGHVFTTPRRSPTESPNVDDGCCVGNSTIRCSRNGLTLEVQAIAVGILRKLGVRLEKNIRRSCEVGKPHPKNIE